LQAVEGDSNPVVKQGRVGPLPTWQAHIVRPEESIWQVMIRMPQVARQVELVLELVQSFQ
jgi:hypothetical protein